jgi:hypothetical protein
MRLASAVPNDTDLTFNVSLFGKNRDRLVLLWNRVVVNNVQCFEAGQSCSSFYLIDEPELDWPSYVLHVNVPGGSSASFLGDFLFRWEATNPGERLFFFFSHFFLVFLGTIRFYERTSGCSIGPCVHYNWGFCVVLHQFVSSWTA